MANQSDALGIIATILSVAGAAAGLAWFIFEQFKVQRHVFVGRLQHIYRRILRIEYFLKDKQKFDLSSDLPDIGPNGSDKDKK